MSSMVVLKTQQSVLSAMANSKSRKISPEEAREQRVSYVYASVKHADSLTKDRVRNLIKAQG